MEFMPDIFNGLTFSAQGIASLLFFLAAAFTAVTSVILFFHWRKYGLGGTILAIIEFVYLGVSAALLLFAFFSLN